MSPVEELRLAALANVEALVARDVGRGIHGLLPHTRGNLARAAESLAAAPVVRLGVLTGFFIPGASPPAAETDGPVGAAQLAAFAQAIGGESHVATDAPCRDAVAAALESAGLDPAQSLEVVPVGARADDALRELAQRWEQRALTHVVAIERPGPGADGRHRNMRGESIDAWTAPFSRLLSLAGSVSIGIGDGGNELGMGSLDAEEIAAHVPRGEAIACVTPCDHLLLVGISNWGALGLIAALGILRPEYRRHAIAELQPERHRRILRDTVQRGGAVDGVERAQRLSVDGLSGSHHEILSAALAALVTGTAALEDERDSAGEHS